MPQAMKTFRYELFQWLDMANLRPVYGVRLHEGGKRSYMGERGKPCLTYNHDEALMFMDILRLSHEDCQ